jgi:hypothetical protein
MNGLNCRLLINDQAQQILRTVFLVRNDLARDLDHRQREALARPPTIEDA